MAKLTPEQLQFLKSQNISTSLLFDGSGYAATERKARMDDLGALFYFGGAPCRGEGHTLRTKAGHCMQCNTANIGFQLRSSASGHVYLAYSPSTRLIKVGYSKFHPQERADVLRREAYGGLHDWDVKRVVYFSKGAGSTEFAIHGELEPYAHPVTYKRPSGEVIECREIFDCDLEHAKKVFDTITAQKK